MSECITIFERPGFCFSWSYERERSFWKATCIFCKDPRVLSVSIRTFVDVMHYAVLHAHAYNEALERFRVVGLICAGLPLAG